MIAANKRLLKATLTQGVLGIQITLIQLYTQNLTAVATQAALLAGFAFAAISSPLDWKEITEAQYILSYFFYFCFTICLIAALYALSQATIVTMFGPSMALKADDSDAVRIASEFMRQQQVKVFNIGVIAISALFIGSAVLTWAIYPLPIAGLCCLCYLFGYYTVLVEGAKAFEIFVPHLDVTVDDELKEHAAQKTGYRNLAFVPSFLTDGGTNKEGDAATTGGKSVRGSGPSGGAGNEAMTEGGKTAVTTATVLKSNDPQERIKIKAKGLIWKRLPLEEGGNFKKCYAVMEKGKMDFYASERHYIDHEDPLNAHPLKLWLCNVETDPRKFTRSVTSVRNTLKAALWGHEDFAVSDMLNSEYDLQYASKNFRFALTPKVSSELMAVDVTEFLAHDDKAYKQWIKAMSTVVHAFDEIAASPSIEHTMRAGTADVETVVQAANVVSSGHGAYL